ncbi:hypothetical protein BD779DRAFT_1469537 [Infundibulicybe gibba]|nr:hypothetical protein BD779DRAFT_1469537 [Infundibulicybe gibba]
MSPTAAQTAVHEAHPVRSGPGKACQKEQAQVEGGSVCDVAPSNAVLRRPGTSFIGHFLGGFPSFPRRLSWPGHPGLPPFCRHTSPVSAEASILHQIRADLLANSTSPRQRQPCQRQPCQLPSAPSLHAGSSQTSSTGAAAAAPPTARLTVSLLVALLPNFGRRGAPPDLSEDGEGGKCVHHTLEVANFVGAIVRFNLIDEASALAVQHRLGLMIIFIHVSPKGERRSLLDTLPPTDETFSAEFGYDVSAGVEALRESERLSFA